jgi:hypothetical protein
MRRKKTRNRIWYVEATGSAKTWLSMAFAMSALTLNGWMRNVRKSGRRQTRLIQEESHEGILEKDLARGKKRSGQQQVGQHLMWLVEWAGVSEIDWLQLIGMAGELAGAARAATKHAGASGQLRLKKPKCCVRRYLQRQKARDRAIAALRRERELLLSRAIEAIGRKFGVGQVQQAGLPPDRRAPSRP